MKALQLVPPKQAPILSLKISNRCRLDDPSYKYVPAAQTDISVRFKEILAAQKQEKKAKTK